MQRKLSFFSGACTGALALTAWGITPPPAQAASSRDALYQGGLSNLRTLSRYFTPEQRSRIPTLEAILHRVVYQPDQATDDELAIGTTLVQGKALDIAGGRGAGSLGQAILALHFKPLVAVNVPQAHAAAVVKPVARAINTNYVKIARAGSSVTYTSGVVRKPGGVSSGYVDMAKGQKKTRIVEIPTAGGDLGVSARARVIARRMASVQQRDPAWWSRITPGQAANGEAVVSLPSGPVPYLLTADASFAKEWNMTPGDLAQSLVTKIRAAIQTSSARAVLTTPAEEAAKEKEAGDDAYAQGDSAGAEQHYEQAIQDSPGYVTAYKLLIGLYKEQKKTARINEIITEAQGEPSLKDDQIKEIQQAAQ